MSGRGLKKEVDLNLLTKLSKTKKISIKDMATMLGCSVDTLNDREDLQKVIDTARINHFIKCLDHAETQAFKDPKFFRYYMRNVYGWRSENNTTILDGEISETPGAAGFEIRLINAKQDDSQSKSPE